ARVGAPRSHFSGPELPALHLRALAAVRGVPGVAYAALSSRTPLGVGRTTTDIEVPGGAALSGPDRVVHVTVVSSEWFATFRTPLLAGREFPAREDQGALPVAIVNETLARKFWNGESPIGRAVILASVPQRQSQAFTVVGVAVDAVYRSLRE